MAAAAAAMRAAYQRIGFLPEASIALTDVQQLRTIDDLVLLADDEEQVSDIVKALRRPGGMIPNPVDPNGPPISDPGVPVSQRARGNLTRLVFWCKHQQRVSREARVQDITEAAIRSLDELRNHEKDHVQPTEKPTIDHSNWYKTLKAVQQYFSDFLGCTKAPLAYVIRDDVAVPDEDEDPADGYETPQEEMIARMPHGTNFYREDNQKVFSLLHEICQGDSCYVYIEKFARAKNGRAAYHELYNHFLGPGATDHLISAAVTQLEKLTYDGETRKWNFEKFITRAKEQHALLESMAVRGDYPGIDERGKVVYLLKSVRDPKLKTVRDTILASRELRNDFEASAQLFKEAILLDQATGSSPMLNISGVKVEDRYFTPEEYKHFTQEDKSKLRSLREARGAGGGGGQGAGGGNGGGGGKHSSGDGGKQAPHKATNYKKKVKRLQRQVASLKAQAKGSRKSDSSDEDDSDKDVGKGGNKNHPALVRQKAKAKK